MDSEYGHFPVFFGGIFMDTWGAGPYILKHRNRVYRFEDSAQFGPMSLDKKGNSKNFGIFSPRSPFWEAHQRWVKAGRPTIKGDEKGWLYCVVEDEEDLK